MPRNFTMVETLAEPPINRAAYSDRTAWLMAVMSSLAYVRFEQAVPLDQLAVSLVKENNERKILSQLKSMIASSSKDSFRNELVSDLKDLGFELIETFDISVPFVVDTQAFLAKLTIAGRNSILVLAFRGTEVNKPADIRSDVDAIPMPVGPDEKKQKVHSGFYKAFEVVEPSIREKLQDEDLKELPLYITGHSLGAALAVVATYKLASDTTGACYTYGGPRVGNLAFGQSIRTPVYRIINAADLVPRLPPTFVVEFLTIALRWLPVIPFNNKIATFLEKFRDYRHYGDLRYLTAAVRMPPSSSSEPATYPGLQLIANPPQFSRWFWLFRRVIATRGRAGVSDHSITTYVEKLAYWGIMRFEKPAISILVSK